MSAFNRIKVELDSRLKTVWSFGNVKEGVLTTSEEESKDDCLDSGSFLEKSRRSKVGMEVNQYKILRLLGEGGEAVVFEVLDKENDHCRKAFRVIEDVSLKDLEEDRQSRRRMSSLGNRKLTSVRAELAILKRMNHPSIVKYIEVLDFSSIDKEMEAVAIVMEYVQGIELLGDFDLKELNCKYWKNGKPGRVRSVYPIDLCASYYAQILAALEYLHHNDIVHGDIKPSNILVDPRTNRIKLIDFGVSRLLPQAQSFKEHPQTVQTSMFHCHGGFGRGTLLFFSPESVQQDSSKFYCGKVADLWAAALTLYVLVYGHFPFFTGNISKDAVLEMLWSPQDFQFPKSLAIMQSAKDKQVENLLKNLLKKDQTSRMIDIPEIVKMLWSPIAIKEYQGLSTNPADERIRDLITDEEVWHVAVPVSFTQSWDSFVGFLKEIEESFEIALTFSAGGAERLAKDALKMSTEGFENISEKCSEKIAETVQGTYDATCRVKRNSFDMIEKTSATLKRAGDKTKRLSMEGTAMLRKGLGNYSKSDMSSIQTASHSRKKSQGSTRSLNL